jgi:hypothetical protein
MKVTKFIPRASITQISKLDKDIHTKKENSILIFLMNIDTKIFRKYLQIKFNNTLKRSYIMIKLLLLQKYKNVQHMQINKHKAEQKSHDLLNRCRKGL